MVARRRLDFSTPVAKRARHEPAMVLYRGVRPEMKFLVTNIAHTATTGSTLTLNQVTQGTTISGRVGAKIKIWRIDYILANSTGNSFRVDLVINNITGSTITHAYTDPVNRNSLTLLTTKFHHAGSIPNARGANVSHKLPVGVISKFTSAAGTTVNHNQILARVTTQATETITGHFRIWYTDI